MQLARSPQLRELIGYWLAIHPRHALPPRAAFDPAAVPKVLRNVVLTDVERDPYRFRVRLMGSAVAAAFGRDFTGQYIEDALPSVRSTAIYNDRVQVAESGLPNYYYGGSTMPFRLDFAPIERVYLPFASDGELVDMILGMVVYLAGGPDSLGRPAADPGHWR